MAQANWFWMTHSYIYNPAYCSQRAMYTIYHFYIPQQYEVYKGKAIKTSMIITSTVVACNGRVSKGEHNNYYDAYD